MIGTVVRIDITGHAPLALPRGAGGARRPRAAWSVCHPTLTSVSPEMGRTSPYGVRPLMTVRAGVVDHDLRTRMNGATP